MASVARKLRREEDKTIGLVPTMGALHEGHLSLVREARRMCDVVVVSVFVNPTQFGPGEDFERYPRDLTGDTTKLADYNVDYIFAPSPDEMYPKGFATYVTVEGLSEPMEGVARPGHFRGVATVLTVLFNTIRPDFAYFGQKDAQQALVVRRLVRDLDLPVEIEVCPTIREVDGLAMSSRNVRLDAASRTQALALRRGLDAAEAAMEGGKRTGADVEAAGRAAMTALGVEPEYFAVVSADTLAPFDDATPTGEVLVAVAARVGGVRLIDNLLLHLA